MSRLLSFAVFFGIALSIVGLVHYYVWVRLVRDLALSAPWPRALTALVVGLFLAIPSALILGRVVESSFVRPLVWVGIVWLGMLLIVLVVLVGLDALRLVYSLGARAFGADSLDDPGRRLLLSRWLAGAATLLSAGLGLKALHSGLAAVTAREVRVRLEKLPSELDGTVLVQLTDMHVGPTLDRAFVEEVVRRTNELRPDLIAITGDLVDGTVEELREHIAPLARLQARYGVYFVTGNHEYYSGADEWCRELVRLGIRVLRNERVAIGASEIGFDLAGIDDFQGRRLPGHGPDLARAVAGRDRNRELVLLAHQPRAVFQAKEHGVGLQLSGHTHGGQIWPWNYFVRFDQPVVSGLARFGLTQVYVSNGTGYWGPPMRLGAPAEITKIVLEAPAEALA